MNNEENNKYELMNKQEKSIYDFLHDCNIVFKDFNHLDGMLIPREMLLDQKKYETVKEHISSLKEVFSLVRQILKTNDYGMEPKRKSNGYDDDGKKKYLRFFIIYKKKSLPENLNIDLEDKSI